MKFINVTADFKHDSQSYYVHERRNVDDALADYFIACGWASEAELVYDPPRHVEPVRQTPEPVTLKVHSVKHSLSNPSPRSK
jgi:hypothetical protein